MFSVRTGYVSITGNFRENNEDSGVVDPQKRFFIVADGMGGQSAGEKASAMAVELIPQKLEQLINFDADDANKAAGNIDAAIEHANSEIMALGEVDPEARNMGTTVVFLVQAGGSFLIGGVGDSRVYMLRDGELTQLTRDHSLTQALLEAGTITEEEAENHRYKNVLYRYLGAKEGGGGSDPKDIKPQAGDRFLLCSDGVTDGAEDDVILGVLTSSDDPQEVAQKLVEAAQEGGSRDNITSLVLFVD
ncbi:MAG: PP2C family serine/threonine-protein phosphatase [Planctomycetaceae bacterium]